MSWAKLLGMYVSTTYTLGYPAGPFGEDLTWAFVDLPEVEEVGRVEGEREGGQWGCICISRWEMSVVDGRKWRTW